MHFGDKNKKHEYRMLGKPLSGAQEEKDRKSSKKTTATAQKAIRVLGFFMKIFRYKISETISTICNYYYYYETP